MVVTTKIEVDVSYAKSNSDHSLFSVVVLFHSNPSKLYYERLSTCKI